MDQAGILCDETRKDAALKPPRAHIRVAASWGCSLVWIREAAGLVSFLYSSWGSHGEYTGVVCHSLLQWIMFCQNSPLWPTRLGWPCRAWLIASLCYASPFAMTRQWSVKGHLWCNGHELGQTSGRWWWTGKPGVLQFMGSQKGGRDWANWTKLNWKDQIVSK